MRVLPRNILLVLMTMVGASLPTHAQADDPPGVVAWLGGINGAVSVSPAGTDTWLDAPRNRPLTTGDRVWVDQGSRAEMHIGATAIRLGPQTSLSFTSLSDDLVQISVTQGAVNLHTYADTAGQKLELDTPNVAFVPSQTGVYRIDVPTTGQTTMVKVLDGQATVYGNAGQSNTVNSGERVVYSGTDASQFVRENNAAVDSLDTWSATQDQADARSTSARYVSRDLVGYQALDANGTWVNDPAYGPVWVPNAVAPNWAPYQDGRWVWIAPWGWTWVDDAPWGFAPSHYGRWAWATRRWAWVPGARVARPVYAPALVAFVAQSGGHGTNVRVTLSNGSPGMAWVPLGPGEAYRPTFHASPRYVTVVNQTVVINQRDGNHRDVYVNAHAPHAVSAAPVDAFTHGQPVHGGDGKLRADALQGAHFVHTADIAPANNPRQPSAGTHVPSTAINNRQVVHAHDARDTAPRAHVMPTQPVPVPAPVAQPSPTAQATQVPVRSRPPELAPKPAAPHQQVVQAPPATQTAAPARREAPIIDAPQATPPAARPAVVHHNEPAQLEPRHVPPEHARVVQPEPKPAPARAEPAHPEPAHDQAHEHQPRQPPAAKQEQAAPHAPAQTPSSDEKAHGEHEHEHDPHRDKHPQQP